MFTEPGRYKIIYTQEFNGETLIDSYEREINSTAEYIAVRKALYSDSHVTNVHVELKEDSNE